ncbi:hypothetical protein YpB42003004_0814 [Yersinia pestis biovar Antiqua str. B42003004]|nr:hypothetical protein YpE1979001_1474 [Yersinia pestis biovar Antiqua str. E1979001]EDR50939.1 hypothetical protein YpB42003004_0814 [Yersinia pestis biovar Antiqua str. B42003004]EDR67026.1 hypothetical protein YpK1973002_2822 [Yersinia pestis biovar Mediaevalis str. K1973002]
MLCKWVPDHLLLGCRQPAPRSRVGINNNKDHFSCYLNLQLYKNLNSLLSNLSWQ